MKTRKMPTHMSEFTAHRKNEFIRYIEDSGASSIAVTNEWEVFRILTGAGVALAHRNAAGRIKWNTVAERLWNVYVQNTQEDWVRPFGYSPKLSTQQKMVYRQETLVQQRRRCFYCGLPLADDISIEHLLERSCGSGTNHRKNMVLAHRECNARMAGMSIYEKVLHRELMHKMNGMPLTVEDGDQ